MKTSMSEVIHIQKSLFVHMHVRACVLTLIVVYVLRQRCAHVQLVLQHTV